MLGMVLVKMVVSKVVGIVVAMEEVEVVVRAMVEIVVGRMAVLRLVAETSDTTTPPVVVAVRSDGTVVTEVTSTEEISVWGMETVSLVVGGSVVVVDVRVTIAVTVSEVVAVLSDGTVAVDVTSTDEISVSGIETVSLVVGGSVVVV